MQADETLAELRVRLGEESTRGVYVTVAERMLIVDIPQRDGGTVRAEIDAVIGRALYMAVSEAVYNLLGPDRPWLRVEHTGIAGWSVVGPYVGREWTRERGRVVARAAAAPRR